MVTLLWTVVVVTSVMIQAIQADQFTVTGLVRDFWPCTNLQQCGQQTDHPFSCSAYKCHPDFENYNGADLGIVMKDIVLPDRKPAYNASRVHPSIQSAASFAEWYTDVPDTNIPFPINITFDNTVCAQSPCDPKVYAYINSDFFPINRMGFGNYVNGRNFHFTFELKTRFNYKGGEVFQYVGDDDLWVFINNKLVIDLGGVHSAQYAFVALDTLNLTVGENYPIDIFFAERHTSSSNFMVYTSLAIYCPWKDHCNICQGNGQSCCTCNDGNPCTVDTCDVLSGACVVTPVSCNQSTDACHTNQCDPTTGTCIAKDISCDDYNVCTVDSCNPQAGCTHTYVSCDDSNACTFDSCDPIKGCKHQTITCDDGDSCTVDSCNVDTGCSFQPMNCDDHNPCTADACSNGQCLHVSIACDLCKYVTCNTSDLCAPQQCDPSNGACHTKKVDCDDSNVCTIDACEVVDGTAGCSHTPALCVPDDSCHVAKCDPLLGCHSTPIDCDDNNPCTTDKCVAGQCVHEVVVCNDSNNCTIDSCNPSFGCDFIPVTCNDGNLCTNDTCDSELGCVFTPVIVDPHPDKCTDQYCDPTVGIVSSPITCRPTDTCHCDPQQGCLCPSGGVTVTTGVAIGAGAIAAIAFGTVVFAVAMAIGGRKGYNYWKGLHAREATVVTENPLYRPASHVQENPIYQPDMHISANDVHQV